MNERNIEKLATVSWDARMLLDKLRQLDIAVHNDVMLNGTREGLDGVIEAVARFTYLSEIELDCDVLVD